MENIELGNSRHLLQADISHFESWPDSAQQILKILQEMPKAQIINRDIYLHLDDDKISVSRAFTGHCQKIDGFLVKDFNSAKAMSREINLFDIYKKEEFTTLVNKFKGEIKSENKENLHVWVRMQRVDGSFVAKLEIFSAY